MFYTTFFAVPLSNIKRRLLLYPQQPQKLVSQMATDFFDLALCFGGKVNNQGQGEADRIPDRFSLVRNLATFDDTENL